MREVSVGIPSPLSGCLDHCEVECVRLCCGIDAISTDPALVAAWCRQVGPDAVAEARRQLAALVEVVRDRSHVVTSTFLNHRTHDDAARGELLDLLAELEAGLARGNRS
ncbi:DUF6331 family protein [Micromonospora sp. NBC_01392]|uniref:DUF6331 family protein n=1 Tax=Micromonospora sp. NBC_01392 TaxID=2903588 RepID=UPI0032454E91